MKEAIIINLDGHMVDVAHVTDEVTGVFPIYETPQPTEADPTPEPALTGYQVAARPPEGLYKLKFDVLAWEAGEYENLADLWGEGLTQAEIDAIRNAPKPETDAEKIARLEAENAQNKQQLASMNANFSSFQDFYFAQFPDQV